jgi:hypothetical protein
MSSWGNNDNAANAPYWAVNSTIMNVAETEQWHSSPDATNVAVLFGNTMANVWTTNETVGLFGVDAQEIGALEGSAHRGLHTGWILRTTGQGGRAGRIQEEVLVAMNGMGAGGSDADAQTYANVYITLAGPSNATVTAGSANSNTVTFTVSPTLTGNTSAALTYQWQVNNGTGAWVNMADGNNAQPGGVRKSGTSTATVSITPWNTTANNYVVRAIVTAADEGVSATSANGQITIM